MVCEYAVRLTCWPSFGGCLQVLSRHTLVVLDLWKQGNGLSETTWTVTACFDEYVNVNRVESVHEVDWF